MRGALRDRDAVLKMAAVGSRSPAKVAAVEAALRRLTGSFVAVTPVEADSGVPEQPLGTPETYRGAAARARAALRLVPGAALGIGIEAGVETPLTEAPPFALANAVPGVGTLAARGADEPLFASAWVVVVGRDGRTGRARSASFELPGYLAEQVRRGVELGSALDAAHGLTRGKDGPGAVGVLTGGAIMRDELYVQAVVLALMPWLAPAGQREPE